MSLAKLIVVWITIYILAGTVLMCSIRGAQHQPVTRNDILGWIGIVPYEYWYWVATREEEDSLRNTSDWEFYRKPPPKKPNYYNRFP